VLLQTVARVVLNDSTETLPEQSERRIASELMVERIEPSLQPEAEPLAPLMERDRILSIGLVLFTPDRCEYVITPGPCKRQI
jgi:hypothetical protein